MLDAFVSGIDPDMATSADWPRFHGLTEPYGTPTFPMGPISLAKLRTYARSDLPDGAKTPKERALRGLLQDYRAVMATDARDKLFALLSLADRTKSPFTVDASAAAALSPNYQLSPRSSISALHAS